MKCLNLRVASRVFFILLGLALSRVEEGWASSFHVSPVRLFLSNKASSALLTMRNESSETLRFQLSAFAWDQNPQGEMLLNPTEDIVFFPVILILAPGEERKVRVGRMAPISSTEKTYRVFVEGMPSPVKSQGSQEGFQVRVLAKVGIPVFVQPAKPVTEGHIQEMAIRGGLFSFQVKNTGNVHFVAAKLRVKGMGSEGEVILEREMEGWYILAGGSRVYELELPKEHCGKIKVLAVEVETGEKTLREKFPLTQGACGQ